MATKTKKARGAKPRGMTPINASYANVASSSSAAVNLAALNYNRKALTIWNDSTAVLYVKHGAGAASNSCTMPLAAGEVYELPLPIYTGLVTGRWASTNGVARVTEGN
jgi:hypothetical protein